MSTLFSLTGMSYSISGLIFISTRALRKTKHFPESVLTHVTVSLLIFTVAY